MTGLGETKLGAWLRKERPEYFYKAQELRDTVTGWLGYIVQTFPHYTRHTVDHSDNIVRQMSHLLFPDKKLKPVVAFSPIEAYVLIAAAYLHDAGMVVPDEEKRSILESEEWKRWVDGAARERWEKVQTIRTAAAPADPNVRNFLADLYTRHLIAEFVRRVHHKRAGRLIAEHPATFAHFTLNEPLVARTIADVCIGHGLSHSELQEPSRYPEQRQLAGDHANVRWMAMVLRLGDLLDMRADRACPLLLNAANPLPPESVAHWTQYQKLTQFLVTPKKIEIGAECDTRDEYQVLRDWTHWIEEEAKNAALAMMHAERHSEWKPPLPKIAIGKSPAATFLVDDWKFELDREAVFDRLIYDVYDRPITFIRELIQNALDATRVQMYLDLDADGLPRPEYPTDIDEARRERYPVEITLETRTVRNEHTGIDEERQVFTITDHGVGMDRDIISRYLLQIGRSWYVSDDFQRDFRFVPTSRFGVGFLSVFAVADQVTIDTYKPASKAQDGPLQLVLRGVRNYILPQSGTRQQRGTRIEVLLGKPLDVAEAVEAIKRWCRRVEFPIRIMTRAGEKVIRSEQPAEFESHVPDLDTPGAEWHVRAYPFRDGGVQGEIYIESRSCAGVERLATNRALYRENHPLHQIPDPPASLVCLHGIESTSLPRGRDVWSYRVDVRGTTSTTLSRTAGSIGRNTLLPEGRRALENVLRTHLATSSASGPDAGRYRQHLVARVSDVSYDFWLDVPMIPEASGEGRLLTFEDVDKEPEIVTPVAASRATGDHVATPFAGTLTLTTYEGVVTALLVHRRHPVAVFLDATTCHVKWGPPDSGNADFTFPYGPGVHVLLLPIGSPRVAVIAAKSNSLIVNQDHMMADWLRAAHRASQSGTLTPFRVGDLLDDIARAAIDGFTFRSAAWRGESVPEELRLPELVPIMPGVLGSPEAEGAG